MAFKQNSPGHIALIRAGLTIARERMGQGEGFLYVADLPAINAVKIGFSLNPPARMKSLGRGSTARPRLIAVTPGTIREELALHRQLRDLQIGHAKIRRSEIYPRSILTHPALPAGLRTAQPRRQPKRAPA